VLELEVRSIRNGAAGRVDPDAGGPTAARPHE
jgi:hypothetical protein